MCVCLCVCVAVCVCGYRLLLGQWQGAPQPHYSLLLSQTSTTATSLTLFRSPSCFISVFFSLPPPRPLESADGPFFAERKIYTHTHTHMHTSLGCRGKDCWQGQRRVVVLYKGCICLLRTDSLNWLPKPPFSSLHFSLTLLSSPQQLLFFNRSRHSWIVIISNVAWRNS